MYVDPAELQLKRQLEQALGRSVSDVEWESLKQAASARPAATSRRPGIVGRGARYLLYGLKVAVWWIAAFLIGAAIWLALLRGLAWGYGYTWKGDSGLAGTLGVITALWFYEPSKEDFYLYGRIVSGCLVAVAIGAIVHVAGG